MKSAKIFEIKQLQKTQAYACRMSSIFVTGFSRKDQRYSPRVIANFGLNMAARAARRRELQTAIAAARAAGVFIKQRRGKPGRVRFKSDINIVTAVDTQAEALIIRRLRAAFPADGILAEERPEEKGNGRKWVIDPLDGTTNFAHGFPFFVVSIGLEEEGQPVIGVVYDPVHDELFTAVRGKGALCNGKRIAVSAQRTMSRAFLATGFAYTFKKNPDHFFKQFRSMMLASMAVRRAGAAALDLCYVACGRFDGFWELDLKPWDTAAASLIVAEAGGKVTRIDGRPYSHYDKSIVASNSHLHKAMVRILSRE